MELRQLQYFMKVAQKEHVTQAAEELHVAQSAVSRQIHQLEEELGVNLFMQRVAICSLRQWDNYFANGLRRL